MISIIIFAVFALLAAAGQSDITDTTKRLSWTGDIPGHGSVTLNGSVDDVEKQIFNLAPALQGDYTLRNPFMSPSPRPFNETAVAMSNGSYSYRPAPATLPGNASITGRSDINVNTLLSSETYWTCGNFATGSYEEAYAAIARVHAPGGVEGGSWEVAEAEDGPSCERLVCNVGTAVYWCNDNAYSVASNASVLAEVASMVAEGYNEFNWIGCCLGSQNRGAHNQYSGQVFIGNGTNMVVGWGNCTNYDYFTPPSDYPIPGAYGACI